MRTSIAWDFSSLLTGLLLAGQSWRDQAAGLLGFVCGGLTVPTGMEPRPARQPMGVEEVLRANRTLRLLALLLDVEFREENLPKLAPIPLIYACYQGWLLEVYQDSLASTWVLILSRGEETAYRAFGEDDLRPAADHVRRFVSDRSYRSAWIRPPQRRIRAHS